MVVFAVALAGAAALWMGGCKRAEPGATHRAELRSWVVAGRGRHLYLEIFDGRDSKRVLERVEFGSTAQRTDYRAPADPRRSGRVSRMTPGVILQPIFSTPDDRIEAEYFLSVAQVKMLRRDVVYSVPYELVGRNSNAAMARALRDAGLALPARVMNGAGLLGEFPGINLDVGREIDAARWGEYGVTTRARGNTSG